MAYVTTNPPAAVCQTMTGASLWIYKSADVVGDVDASGYFTNGVALGMKVGDPVLVIDTATPLTTMCWVSAVGTATATVTQHA